MPASIKILRPLNISLSLIAVIISAYLIDALNSPLLPHVCLIVFCFAGASNILNDVLDIHIDKINQPNRVLPSRRIRVWNVLMLMGVLYAIGIISSTYLLPLGRNISLMLVLPLLVLYTPVFKKIPLVGNLVVGSILGLVFLFTEGSIYGTVDKMWIPFCLASGLSTIRELVKDGADIEGDAFSNLQTFPRKFGLPATIWTLRIISICLCMFALIPWLEGYYNIIYLVLLVLLVEFPLLWLIFIKLKGSSAAVDYIYSSSILKGITIAGMAVILSTGV